ncbi:hypothetical protein [Nocardia mangyaensis]|uniref:hypothetical protein n=1 Tax=Nocardia mangyaensis TaxID=2213200 RepID=UPI0012EBE301|nr:hypothetical protein [Nocardia mangyaensis]
MDQPRETADGKRRFEEEAAVRVLRASGELNRRLAEGVSAAGLVPDKADSARTDDQVSALSEDFARRHRGLLNRLAE